MMKSRHFWTEPVFLELKKMTSFQREPLSFASKTPAQKLMDFCSSQKQLLPFQICICLPSKLDVFPKSSAASFRTQVLSMTKKSSLGSRRKGWASDWWGKKLWSHTKVEEFQSCQLCPTSPTSRNCSWSFEKKLRIQLMTYVPVAQSKVHFNLITLLFFNITVLWYSWWSATLGHFSPQKILCTKFPMFCSPAAGMEVVN